MIVGALATSKNVINCEFASSKLQGNISVEVLHDGLVFSNSLVLQIVNAASVFSVSKRFIGTSGGSVVETHFRHNLPSNANLWCRFDTLVVIPASISLLSAICLSPPLAEGLTTFSLLVDDQTFSDEILLTVIPSPVIYSLSRNFTDLHLNAVSLIGSYPSAFSDYFACYFKCHDEDIIAGWPDLVTKTLVMCSLPRCTSGGIVFIKVDNVSSNIFQIDDDVTYSITTVQPSSIFGEGTNLLTFTGAFCSSCDCPFLHRLLTTSFASRKQMICLFQNDGNMNSGFLQISNISIPILTAKLVSIHPSVCFAGCHVQLKGFFPNASVVVSVDGIIHFPFSISDVHIHFSLQQLSQSFAELLIYNWFHSS
jgi:hypothetical protein